MRRAFLVFVLPICSCVAAELEEQKRDVEAVSPSGAYQIESVLEKSSSPSEDATSDFWVVSTADRSQRARLPKQSPDSPTDDEFHFSPNEEWLFGLRHVGSCLREGNIYHLLKPLRVEVVGKEGHFNELVWEKAVKLGASKRNWAEDGCAMTFFGGWSGDSSRLLIQLGGAEKRGDLRYAFFYFNTWTNDFEATAYSRKLSQSKSTVLTCAEPVDPLPAEADLQKKLDSLDQRLNKKYAEILAKADKNRVSVIREAQRAWLKKRDAGEKLYTSFFPAAEKSQRRLQFLADTAAVRIETPPDQWEQ